MVIVVVAQRPFILNEEARGAVTLSLGHLGQREGYRAHPIKFVLCHSYPAYYAAEWTDSRRTERPIGLGLYIASEIANAHHGDISASSEENETVFTVRLPRLSDSKK